MQTERIEMDRDEALALYREYRKSRRYETKIDAEVKRTYRAISQGKVVIRALESIANAGLKEDGFPALAICRADATHCEVNMGWSGGATFYASTRDRRVWSRAKANRIELRAGVFPRMERKRSDAVAVIPQPPLHLRPHDTDLSKYHTLWEAEWSPIPPRDPMLLRRIGDADLWVVVAHWDLTEVERAALATRI